jgi:hypothetical protein
VNAENFSIRQLLTMAHSPVHNYAIPGLSSWLIGQPGPAGTVRLFQCEREHQEAITPHSHRFDFQCWVLEGSVRNRIWKKHHDGDAFIESTLAYGGDVGKYAMQTADEPTRWGHEDRVYEAGQCYSMKADEVHSIYFSRGARVLFFEGPTKAHSSVILEPWVNNERVPTMEVRPWMFQRPAAGVAQVKEPLGRCCYGGAKTKRDCASCAAWTPIAGVAVDSPANERVAFNLVWLAARLPVSHRDSAWVIWQQARAPGVTACGACDCTTPTGKERDCEWGWECQAWRDARSGRVAPGAQPPADAQAFTEKLALFERLAHRAGELWERCQGKGWPDAESDEFTRLRDERMPALRAEIRAAACGVKEGRNG